jgi:hypothetical protein
VTGWLSGVAHQVDTSRYADDDSTIDTHLAAMEDLIHGSEFFGVDPDLPSSTRPWRTARLPPVRVAWVTPP